jgi:hypothetical protein
MAPVWKKSDMRLNYAAVIISMTRVDSKKVDPEAARVEYWPKEF